MSYFTVFGLLTARGKNCCETGLLTDCGLSDINVSVKWAIIGSGYGLSHVQHQTIAYTSADVLWIWQIKMEEKETVWECKPPPQLGWGVKKAYQMWNSLVKVDQKKKMSDQDGDSEHPHFDQLFLISCST